MRSGSTWAQTMLAQLRDVATDYELKWKPAYNLDPLHIPVDEKFSFKSFFDGLGQAKVKGSKLTFDFFTFNESDLLSQCIPSEIAIVHLTRNYFEVLNSYYRGICHNYQENASLALKSPMIHNALMRSQRVFSEINNKKFEEKKRKISEEEAAKILDIFLSVDEWSCGLSSKHPYFRLDYSELNEKFIEMAKFIGSKEKEEKMLSVLESPPTSKLPIEMLIENEIQIKKLANAYQKKKLSLLIQNSS